MKQAVFFISTCLLLHAANAQSQASGSSSDDGAVMAIVIIGLYFAPMIIAYARRATGSTGIFLLSLLLGWTVIGWVVALIWAVSGETVAEANAKKFDYTKLAAAMQARTPPPPQP